MQHGEVTLLYLNQYRSYMLAYTDGPRRIAALLQQSDDLGVQDRETAWKNYAKLTGQVSPDLPAPKESEKDKQPLWKP